jgi:pantothenate kinase
VKTLDFTNAAARLCQLAQNTADRTLIALAGVPGSGKSTLARDLAAEVNRRAGPHAIVALGMDGFHLPKAALRAMPDPAAALARRGAPWTFDPAAMAAQLDILRHSAGVTWCGWPAFEHGTGDPVPRANAVAPPTRVVLVEGLYVLHREDGWAPVAEAFDEHWFLDTPLDLSLERLAARHMASWKMSREQAGVRIAGNDRLNAEIVLASRARADAVIAVCDWSGGL